MPISAETFFSKQSHSVDTEVLNQNRNVINFTDVLKQKRKVN